MCLPYHRKPRPNRVKWYRCSGQRTSRAGSLPKPTEGITGTQAVRAGRTKGFSTKQLGPEAQKRQPHEKDRQKPKVDVVVPGYRRSRAALLRTRAIGCVCPLRGGFRSDRRVRGRRIYVAQGLG